MSAFKKKYRTEYVVEGDGDFPHDMLRYDEAFPARETDGRAMGHQDRRQITLAKYHTDPQPQIAIERWRSFTWRVLHIVDTRKLT